MGIHENFLSNPEEKAKLLDQLKARKGEHFTDFALCLPTNSMVERLAHSLDMTKNQVIIPSS